MTALKFRTAIMKLGLSQVQASHLLGVTPRTARRWALGEVNIPPPAEKLLRLVLAGEVSIQKVREAKPQFGA
jgi:DNA-binding transcriptional regulator YiaG